MFKVVVLDLLVCMPVAQCMCIDFSTINSTSIISIAQVASKSDFCTCRAVMHGTPQIADLPFTYLQESMIIKHL